MSADINLINKIVVLDEGTIITSDVKSLNFTGPGVTATSSDGDVTIDITGGGGGGSVTGVTASTPLSSTGGTTPDISIQQANSTQSGYLSSTDWNTFNSKGSGSVTSVSALTIGTTGTDISSSVVNSSTTPVITINIPTASAVNRGALSAADWTTFNDKVSSSLLGANNGVATLDSGGKVPVTQLPNSIMDYKGTYDIVTNTPTLVNGTGNAGDVYINTAVGTRDFGAGPITVAIGDWLVYDGSVWQKTVNSNAVASVNGYTGIVVLNKSDIGLSNVENTALSTWAGSTNITTVGTIGSGTWNGTPIGDSYLSSSFVKTNGTTPLTANWNAGAYEITANKFIGNNGFGFNLGLGGTLVSTSTTGTAKTWTLPDTTGTIALTSDIPSISGYIKADGTVPLTANWNAGTYRITTGNITSTGNALVNGLTVGIGSYTGGVPSPNTALGYLVLPSNTTGVNNIAIGRLTLYRNTTGSQNVAIGDNALYESVTTSNNTAVGYNSAQSTTTGTQNVSVGYNSLNSNTTGGRNSAFGHGSLQAVTVGVENTAVGYAAASGASNLSSFNYNVTVGAFAMTYHGGTENTAIGYSAMLGQSALPPTNTSGTGNYNTALGSYTLYYNTTGTQNSVVGKDALRRNTVGSSNIAFGYQAAYYIADGSTINTSSQQSIFLGANTKPLTASDTNQIVIGYNTIGKGTNTTTIGLQGTTTDTWLAGYLHVNSAYKLPNVDGAVNQVLQTDGSGNVSWATVSSGGGGITSLNGLSAATQTFAVGTSGTDFGISSTASTHTFNIPTASATNRGLLSAADWTTFNNKGNGTVTSVGLSMPSAFTVTSSPVTGSGTIAVTGAGTTAQYIAGDGTLVTFPTVLPTNQIIQDVKLGEAIPTGYAVYVFTADGTNIIVKKASNTSEATSSKTLGLLVTGGALNAQTTVLTNGKLGGLDTSAATEGDAVWLGTGGQLLYGLANKPYAPAHLVYIGVVTRANVSNGEIFVNVQNGFELYELHNVSALSPSNNDGLFYNTSTSLWETNSIKTILGAASSTADGYLTSTDWSTFNGKQNALTLTTTGSSGSATLVGSTLNIPTYTLAGLGGISLSSLSAGTPLSYNSSTGAFSIQAATTAQNGYLSFTDWNTFNSKIGGSGTTNYVPKFTASGTLGNSSIFNDTSGNIGINTITPSAKLDIKADLDQSTALNIVNIGDYTSSFGGTGFSCVVLSAIDYATGGTISASAGNLGSAIGLDITAVAPFGQTSTGIKISASGGANNYALQLQDGSQTVGGGKFLKDMGNGNANWATLTVANTGLTITTTGTSGAATLVGNTLNIPQYSGGTATFDYGLSYAMASQNILL